MQSLAETRLTVASKALYDVERRAQNIPNADLLIGIGGVLLISVKDPQQPTAEPQVVLQRDPFASFRMRSSQ